MASAGTSIVSMRAKAAINSAVAAANGAVRGPGGGLKGYGRSLGRGIIGSPREKARLVGFEVSVTPAKSTSLTAHFIGSDDTINTYTVERVTMLTAENAASTATDLAKMLKMSGKAGEWARLLTNLAKSAAGGSITLPPTASGAAPGKELTQ